MCRYGIQYKNTFACFKCRKGFKRRLDKDLLSQTEQRIERLSKAIKSIKKDKSESLLTKPIVKCPDCGGETVNLGKDLRLPKKDKQEEWLAIEYLANNHFNFFTCGCNGIGFVPHSLQEAYELIERRRNKTEGEKLLQRLNDK